MGLVGSLGVVIAVRSDCVCAIELDGFRLVGTWCLKAVFAIGEAGLGGGYGSVTSLSRRFWVSGTLYGSDFAFRLFEWVDLAVSE